MKNKLIVLVMCCDLLQGCSWIDAFYVINATNKPLAVEIVLKKDASGIFENDTLCLFEGDKKLDYEKRKYIRPTTLEDPSHFMFIVPPHSTIQIGTMMNGPGAHYTAELVKTPGFNLQELWIKRPGEELKITPDNFNDYFKSGDLGRFDYKIKS